MPLAAWLTGSLTHWLTHWLTLSLSLSLSLHSFVLSLYLSLSLGAAEGSSVGSVSAAAAPMALAALYLGRVARKHKFVLLDERDMAFVRSIHLRVSCQHARNSFLSFFPSFFLPPIAILSCRIQSIFLNTGIPALQCRSLILVSFHLLFLILFCICPEPFYVSFLIPRANPSVIHSFPPLHLARQTLVEVSKDGDGMRVVAIVADPDAKSQERPLYLHELLYMRHHGDPGVGATIVHRNGISVGMHCLFEAMLSHQDPV